MSPTLTSRSCCGDSNSPQAASGPTAANTAVVKFHTSLNVSDLARSIGFYRLLFDCEPAKQRPDYAKFELSEPSLVLSLIPGRPAPGGGLNHFGLRVTSAETLVETQRRLELGGIRTQREDGVECCYARQTKFWVADPDQFLWEIHILHEDTDEHGDGEVPKAGQLQSAAFSTAAAPADSTAAATGPGTGTDSSSGSGRAVWRHRIGEPIPVRLSEADHSVHEAELEGTANLSPASFSLPALLREIHRILRPGGTLRLHGLTGDHPLNEPLTALPGPAAAVKHVPSHREVVTALLDAGFLQPKLETLSVKAHFTVGGTALREIVVTAAKPGHRPPAKPHTAIYLGPHAAVTGDHGLVFPGGEPVALNVHDWQTLSRSAAAGDFLLL